MRIARHLIILLLLGCNGAASSIDNQISDAKEALKKEDEQARTAYKESFQTAIRRDVDTALRKKLLLLDSSVTRGAHYMDSIYEQMSFLASHDPTNFDYVKELFLYKGVGDSLYSILIDVNDLARKIAEISGHISSVDSLKITVLNQPTADNWKHQDFDTLNPFAAMTLVHDFTYEIFQVAKECLPGK